MITSGSDAVLWLHLAVTLYLVGVIWCVQIVHYPLMARVAEERFPAFHEEHSTRIGWIVMLPMAVEMVCALVLTLPNVTVAPRWMTWTGAGLVLVIWGSTFLLQVPCHQRLAAGFDAEAHRRLVVTNWLRTAAWTARGLLALAITQAALSTC